MAGVCFDGCHMEAGQPSRTAQGAAVHRAAHQLLDPPLVFKDALALRIIGPEAEAGLRGAAAEHATVAARALRAFIAARSRFAEDSFTAARVRGVRQYVLLGAGLDTFAYRADGGGLTVFEVDHPATQAWKRERLAEVQIAVPSHVVFAPVNFETETVAEGLVRAGLDKAQPAFFAWLGVVPYLTAEAVYTTLSLIVATMPAGSEIVFDYTLPIPQDGTKNGVSELAARVAAVGEPLRSFFEPATLAQKARSIGFSEVEDLDGAVLNARYFRGRADGLEVRGRAHVVKLRV